MDTSDILIWIVFLLGAPAVLYWLWKSNRQRREHWRRWCRERAWRLEIDNEGAQGSEHAPGLPAFPIELSRFRRQSMDLLGRGTHGDMDAATWEWQVVWRDMPKRGHGATITNKLHAVALRLPAQGKVAPFCLLPPQMRLLSSSGFLSLPETEPGTDGPAAHWTLRTRDAEQARDWMRAHPEGEDAMTKAPVDLAVFQVEDDWVVAWHLGETKLERIEPALAWLSRFARAAR